MGNLSGLTTQGQGLQSVAATLTKQGNGNLHPGRSIAPTSGNLTLVLVSTTVTITAGSSWENIISTGDEILCQNFVNSANNGRFTVTSATETTVVFENSDAINEVLASAADNIRVLYTPQKVHLDVVQTSGVPNYGSANTDSTLTVAAIGGVYSYMSAINKTDADAVITISGGSLICPTNSSIAHEVKAFTNDVTMKATGASEGSVHLNIS